MSSPIFPSGGKLKGAALRALLSYWAHEQSPAQRAAFVRALPEDARQGLRLDPGMPGFGVLAGSWYSAATTAKVLDAVYAGVAPVARDAYAKRLAEQIMGETLSGVHKAVFRVVGSPRLMRDHAQTFWNRQFDSGSVVVRDIDHNAQRHEYHDWRAHHPLICKLTFYCVAPMFRAMGVEDPKVELEQCVADGSEYCSAIVRWR